MSFRELLEKKAFVVGGEYLKSGEIPSITVWGKTLPEVWENAVLATWEFGTNIPTEYDQAVDPESRDATVMMVVTSPFQEPRIHKALPCGYDDLEIYRLEVVEGIHDYKVGEEGWSYSYHDRITHWPGEASWQKIDGMEGVEFELPHIDQIDLIVNKLATTPHSRRSQAITWVPWIDGEHHEPPCLQRIWCRVVKSESNSYLLEMNTHWRSRDLLKAAFMNMWALTALQRKMAEEISTISGKKVRSGRYVDINDSLHLYGSYERRGEVERFLKSVETQPFEQRVVRSDEPVVLEEFARGRKRVEEEFR